MNKKAALVVIIIIIIIIGIILAVSYSNNQPAVPSESPQIGTSVSPSPVESVTPVTSPSSSVSSSPSPTSSVTAPQNHSVSYTDQGFSPKSITIKNGDTVTWTNNSSGRLWVASDPHPQHTDLPGFDEKAAINPAGSWTYTFKVKGSHGYHNHANHNMTGTVIVE